jgi:flagellar biosynthesis protein FlhA
MVAILETLADYGAVTKDPSFLIEKVRQALARQICLQYADDTKTLRVHTLMPKLEQAIIDSRVETAGGLISALKPDIQRRWITTLANTVRKVQEEGYFPIILCSEAARPLVRASTVRDFPDLVVLSVPEILPEMKLEALGEIRLEG